MALLDQQTLRKTVRHILLALLIVLWSAAAYTVIEFLIIPILRHSISFNIYSWIFYILLTLFSLLTTTLPVWRFSVWLNAVTYRQAQDKDLARVNAWTTASQSLYVFFIILYDLNLSNVFPNQFTHSGNS